MITVGIDLSTDPKKTGVACIRWAGAGATLLRLEVGWDVSRLADLRDDSDWIAIDAPFGWPDPFVRAIVEWSRPGNWNTTLPRDLRYRLTDQIVSATKYPLSVSSDRIASTAMKCAELLAEIGRREGRTIDRTGGDRIVEVYPAGALTVWRAELVRGYKGAKAENKARRAEIVARLFPERGWLSMSATHRIEATATDDLLDAILCALVARAAAISAIQPLPTDPDELARVRREGWIYLPVPGSPDGLANA